jgi:hypothetical protein
MDRDIDRAPGGVGFRIAGSVAVMTLVIGALFLRDARNFEIHD